MEGPTLAELLRDFIVATENQDAIMQQAYYNLIVRQCQTNPELLGTDEGGNEVYGIQDNWNISDGNTGLVITFAVELVEIEDGL